MVPSRISHSTRTNAVAEALEGAVGQVLQTRTASEDTVDPDRLIGGRQTRWCISEELEPATRVSVEVLPLRHASALATQEDGSDRGDGSDAAEGGAKAKVASLCGLRRRLRLVKRKDRPSPAIDVRC